VGTFLPNSAKPIVVQGIDPTAQFAAPTALALFGNLIQTCSQAGIAHNCTATDNRQWAPRFGFAWRPFDEKTVIRGGYGIFYEVESSTNRVNHFMVPYQLNETVFNAVAPMPYRTMANFFVGRPIGASTTNPSLAGGYPKMRNGYDQHWIFGVQRELPFNSALEADYVGNRGVHLFEGVPVNDPPAGSGPIQARRPYPTFGGITYEAQDNSTIYHALQTKFQKRFSGGLWSLVSYTWSKSISRANTPALGGDTFYERALTPFDIPHNLTASVGYELPFGSGKRFLSNPGRVTSALLGGWQLQAITILRSGRPFTATISQDRSNTGIGGQRPIRLRSGRLSNPTIAHWFDITAFMLPANLTYGNSGTNILREDRFKNLDLSLFKQFQINERTRLQFRAEAFNATNTASFSIPNTNIDDTRPGLGGGTVSSTQSGPRNLQFAVKIYF
jgi:hypothetical protein